MSTDSDTNSEQRGSFCGKETGEDDGARKMIDKLTKTEGNDICADCGEKS